MKSLRFKSLQLLSEREKKARAVQFHPNRNLILGLNHVGKSALTKQIFETLGATPMGKLEGWDNATITLLTAIVDDKEFLFMKQLSNRAIFNSEGQLVACTGRLAEWAKIFGKFMDFNLVLGDKSEKVAQADTACMFLPFYINQDGGWSGIWHTFSGLSRFHNPTKGIVEYFTQVVPPKFYLAKADFESEQRAISSIDADIRILNRTRERLSESLDIAGPQLTPDGFEAEISELVRQLTVLNAQQETYRAESVSLQESLASADHQIALTTDALKKYKDDFDYLAKPLHDELVCPTCGAQHEESFLSTLNFTEDARALAEMLLRLQETRAHLSLRVNKCLTERELLGKKYADLQVVLETKRGELKFSDVIKSMGSGVARTAFDQEDHALQKTRSGHLIRGYEFEQQMKALRDPKRRKAIKAAFQGHYENARRKLNLNPKDVSEMQVSSRPDISGSGGPREVLAYYAGLWWVSRSPEFDSPFSVPIIVDCPAQSGQDAVNLPAMLHFISTGLPPDAQVFVTHEADVAENFDARISLTVPYSLLQESEYAENAELILPKLQLVHKALLEKAQAKEALLNI
jgi:hypothetical protein